MAVPAREVSSCIARRFAPRPRSVGESPELEPAIVMVCADGSHPRRQAIERFIADRYAATHGVRCAHFLPVLVALTDAAGEPYAAAGYAPAGPHELFLERYLGQSVERVFAARTRNEIERATIVEVGNLAATRPGDTRRLIAMLTALLHGAGFAWAAFTATRQVRNAIARCGLLGYDFGRARADAPGIDPQLWGSYYEHDPRVIGGSVSAAAAALRAGALPLQAR
jgi:hypothetical protein